MCWLMGGKQNVVLQVFAYEMSVDLRTNLTFSG